MKTKPRTYIAIILDCSGSMALIHESARAHFNEQVQTLKKKGKKQDIIVTLVMFSDSVTTKFLNKSLSTLKELKKEDYNPNGNTALYDAMGNTIEQLSEIKLRKSDAVLITTISDGEENSSTVYTKEKLHKLIESKTKTGQWTFTYMGANQDVKKVAKDLGIFVGNTQLFAASVQGMMVGNAVHNSALTGYLNLREQEVKTSSSFYVPQEKDNASNS